MDIHFMYIVIISKWKNISLNDLWISVICKATNPTQNIWKQQCSMDFMRRDGVCHKNKQHFCLKTYIFTKLSQIICLINTSKYIKMSDVTTGYGKF